MDWEPATAASDIDFAACGWGQKELNRPVIRERFSGKKSFVAKSILFRGIVDAILGAMEGS